MPSTNPRDPELAGPPWTTLVTSQQLGASIKQSDWSGDGASIEVIVFDCRFSLANIEEGELLFLEGHIPGAFYAHLEDDLSGPITPGKTGRHPLPDPREFVDFLRQRGVSDSTQVVCYDDKGGAIAARLWWMCKWIGLENVAVLDGGIQSWVDAGNQVQQMIPSLPKSWGSITSATRHELVADFDDVRHRPETVSLVDARAGARFRGEEEPIDPIAGHIPGAVSLPFSDNLSDGRFRGVDDLHKRFSELAGVDDGSVICYCGSGVTAAHDALAMVHAGYPMPRLYVGSWSDWIVHTGSTDQG